MEGSIINGAAVVVKTLESLGVERIYGIPGIHNLDIYDKLLDSSITHITARNESGAGFMALGTARISGKPACSLVITGPGLSNILTPMGEAYHDGVPMLVISSQIPRNQIDAHQRPLHEMEHSSRMASSVSKRSTTVLRSDEIEDTVRQAYSLASEGCPGPVHLEIPLDILQGEAAQQVTSTVNTEQFQICNQEQFFQEAAELLSGVERTVIICGGGAVAAGKQISSLLDKSASLILSSTAGKGIVDESHPRSLGARLHFPESAALLQKADLIIAVGTQLSSTDLWDNPIDFEEKLILINSDQRMSARFPNARLSCICDSAECLEGMLRSLSNRPKKRELTSIQKGLEQERKQILDRCDAGLSAVSGIREEKCRQIDAMIRELRSSLGDEVIMVSDMTSPAYLAISQWCCSSPNRFLHPVGFGTLGYALPVGIGIAAAKDSPPLFVLVGDGGFQFTIGELAVAAELGAPLPIIIWNNGGYGEIRRTEDYRHPGSRIAVDLKPPRFEELAAAYRCSYTEIASSSLPAGIGSCVQEALKEKRPRIIEINASA